MSVTNSPSVETYKAYAEALNARDIDRTRTYLHDDLTYQGPVGEIQGADAYLKQVSALGLHQEVRKIFVDGAEPGDTLAVHFISIEPARANV